MKYVRNILILLGIQGTIIVTILLQNEYQVVYYEKQSMKSVIILLLAMIIPVLFFLYMNWLERRVMDQLIDVQTNKRLEAYQLEQDIRNHEVFRELQMIKVIAESEHYEELDEFLA